MYVKSMKRSYVYNMVVLIKHVCQANVT